MMEINNECDQLVKANHMQSAMIKRRHKQLNEQLVTTVNHCVICCCIMNNYICTYVKYICMGNG